MKIGVMVESFRQGFRGGVEKAAALGAQGIQAYATYGELAPENLTEEKIREALDFVKSHGLVFSALCGDFGHGFMNPEENKIYVEKSKRVLDLAKKLECNVVTTHIGTVPEEENETKEIMRKACRELAEYADSVDAAFAVETGPEPASVLCRFLDGLHSSGVSVNLDPANLVMVNRDDPVAAVHTLKKYIVHTHAKDGRQLHECDPEVVYGVRPRDPDCVTDKSFIELPLGEGDVPFPAYLKALEDVGYRGFLTIEREVGDHPERDIASAVDFLKNLIG